MHLFDPFPEGQTWDPSPGFLLDILIMGNMYPIIVVQYPHDCGIVSDLYVSYLIYLYFDSYII